MIEVRHAGPGDGDVLGEIHSTSWAAAYAPFFPPRFAAEQSASRRTRWHARVAEDAPGTVLLASRDARPLALSYFGRSPTRPGLAEIYGFYGHPEGWGTGVAPALMTATLDALRESGYGRVHLWTMRDTPQSRRFYEKCGFVGTGAGRRLDFGDGNPLDQVGYERGC